MGKISQFTITFNTPQPVYYPGQSLSGNVTLDLNQPMDMRGIRIKLQGIGYCRWTESHSSGSGKNRKTRTVTYTGKETIVDLVQVLYGDLSSSSKTYKHPGGRHMYPFGFTLPQPMPSSFEGAHGHIRYILKAKIDKPWKFDHKVKCPVTINDIIDTNNPIYAEGRGGEKHKDVGCMCCQAGPLDFNASIDRSCFCPGEAILINAMVQNQTTRDMQSMHAKLIQTITYHASRKNKTTTREIARLKGPMIPRGQDVRWTNQAFGIPAVPPTISNSGVITVHYKVKVVVGVPWGIDPVVKMHITMGTVPYMKVYGQAVQYGTPEDQQQPPEANFIGGHEYPPPQPSFLGYPDMVPPSYSAAVGESGVNIGNEKDKHTYGDLRYNPVYTFARPYQGTYDWATSHSQYPPNQNQAPPPYQAVMPPPHATAPGPNY